MCLCVLAPGTDTLRQALIHTNIKQLPASVLPGYRTLENSPKLKVNLIGSAGRLEWGFCFFFYSSLLRSLADYDYDVEPSLI